MPRAVISAVLLCALTALATASTATAPAAGPSRLMVSASEWDLTLSRARLAPGRAIVQLLNRGEDDHDLRLKRTSGRAEKRTARWRVTAPGKMSERRLRLEPGRYRLWCSLPGHRKLGMSAIVRVSQRR